MDTLLGAEPRFRSGLRKVALVCLLFLTACNSGEEAEDKRTDRRSACTRAAPKGPAVALHYRVESSPTAPGSFAETKSALCSRLDTLRLPSVQVTESGSALVVRGPRRLEEDVTLARMPGDVRFYDWEPNVTGQRGAEVPFAGRTALFQAVQRASRMSPRAESTDIRQGAEGSPANADRLNDGSGSRFYLFGADRRLVAGPAVNRGSLTGARGSGRPRGSQVLEVPQGIVVVEAERSPGAAQPERYLVLEDDVELSRSGIADPRARADSRTGEPVVELDFTDAGRTSFAALTARVAQRGAAAGPGDPDTALQRFAIVLDDRIVTLATVDPREFPGGLDGRTGVQIGGFTSLAQARRVARLLQAPLLPGNLVPVD